jgi:predicted transposase YdaD
VRRIRQRGTAAKGKEEGRTQGREEVETSADRRRRKPELGAREGEDDIDGDDIPRVPPLVG